VNPLQDSHLMVALENLHQNCTPLPLGTTNGVVTVTGYVRVLYKGGSTLCYVCRCVCGKFGAHTKQNIAKGRSCGCRKNALISAANATHHMTYSPTWGSWQSMMRRCDPKNAGRRMGRWWAGRGINVCERWHEFANFLSDMGERPEGTSLDRINNDGHYEPGNCRWASAVVQGRNRSSTKIVEFGGRKQALKTWCEELRLSYPAVQMRLGAGWSVEDALTKPMKPDRRRKLLMNSRQELVQWVRARRAA